jgi:hypothetical protein
VPPLPGPLPLAHFSQLILPTECPSGGFSQSFFFLFFFFSCSVVDGHAEGIRKTRWQTTILINHRCVWPGNIYLPNLQRIFVWGSKASFLLFEGGGFAPFSYCILQLAGWMGGGGRPSGGLTDRPDWTPFHLPQPGA